MSVAHTSQCSENGDVGHCELGDMVAGICIMIATAPKMIKTSQGREDETPHWSIWWSLMAGNHKLSILPMEWAGPFWTVLPLEKI